VLCEVYATRLALVVQHWLLLTGCWAYPDRSVVNAAQTGRHHALHLARTLAYAPALEDVIALIHRCLAAGCRLNRRKKKPTTCHLLLDPTLGALHCCESGSAHGTSAVPVPAATPPRSACMRMRACTRRRSSPQPPQ
jgi:hypothetical protein